MKTALLLIAHGSRQAEANDDLFALTAELRNFRAGSVSDGSGGGPYAIVEPAFLEIATPTIETAAQRCVTQGAERVALVPYFLSAGVHVRHDLQGQRDKLAAAYPGVEFVLAEPLGRHPLLREIVLERAQKACAI